MKSMRSLAAIVAAGQVTLLAVGGAHAYSGGTPTSSGGSLAVDTTVRASTCTLDGPAWKYAPAASDFGRAVYTTRNDEGYWDGRGYLFGFEQQDRESMMSSPWGGYLVGGVVIAENEGVAARDFQDAVADWPKDWYTAGPVERVTDVPTIGAETVVLRRLSTWEIDKQQPMTEVFLAFRYCNVNAHLMLATMPEFDALTQALRYASIMRARIQG